LIFFVQTLDAKRPLSAMKVSEKNDFQNVFHRQNDRTNVEERMRTTTCSEQPNSKGTWL
jgi:sarcosine oxidase delta subunit